jgi:hypothetical protein
MAKLHELIAVEKDTKSLVDQLISKVKQIFAAPDLFVGFHRNYEPIDPQDPERFDPEMVQVRMTVPRVFEDVEKAFTRITDLIIQKEKANTEAIGEIVLGEKVIGNIPVAALVQLEKYFDSLLTIVSQLPMLDGAKQWEQDSSDSSLFRTPEHKKMRGRKEEYPMVLYEATKEHPAQTKVCSRDVPAGYYTTIAFSGGVTVDEKRHICDRAEQLLAAIKKARSRANTVEVSDTAAIGKQLIDFVIKGK